MALDKNGALSISDEGTVATYFASGAFAPAALATDIITITGSSTKVIKIKMLRVSGTQTTSGVETFYLIKRSTADTGGTSVNPTKVAADSNDPASTATIAHYTANPTVGTLIGVMQIEDTTVESAAVQAPSDHFPEQINAPGGRDIVLRGTETLAVNLNGVTITGGSLTYSVAWTEEPLN